MPSLRIAAAAAVALLAACGNEVAPQSAAGTAFEARAPDPEPAKTAVVGDSDASCPAFRAPWWGSYEFRDCRCGSDLANLSVTLPEGLSVAGVCGLRYTDGSPVDLSRVPVALDGGDRDTQGWVFLTGTMRDTVSGTVMVHEGPAGDLWFNIDGNGERPLFWRGQLSGLDLGTDEHYARLGAPRPGTFDGECMEAEATLRLRDPVVLIGDTDEAGTDAQLDVIRVSEYRACDL